MGVMWGGGGDGGAGGERACIGGWAVRVVERCENQGSGGAEG